MTNHCTKTNSKEALLKAGSRNSLEVFVDDPQNIANLSDVFVDFYSGCTKSTIARGTEENSAKGNGEERHKCGDKEDGRGIDDGVGEEPGATRRLEPKKRGKLI